jgi:hypothetical protein
MKQVLKALKMQMSEGATINSLINLMAPVK